MEFKKESKGIKIYVNPQIEERFRKAAMMMYGYGRGALSQAGEAALDNWSSSASLLSITNQIKDPVLAIEGMLSGVKKTSVELQHEASELRSEKTLHHKS